jgi:hypothetical protein
MRITDITGVAEITEKRGLKKARTRGFSPAAIPSRIPRGAEITIPRITLTKLFKREQRNLSVFSRAIKRFRTGRGPGRISSLPEIREAASQQTSRLTMPSRVHKNFPGGFKFYKSR